MNLAIIAVLILTLSDVNANTVYCNSEPEEGYKYVCSLKIEDEQDPSSLQEFIEHHSEGKNHEDVKGLLVNDKIKQSNLIARVCQKFPNIQKLIIQNLALDPIPENLFASCSNLKDLLIIYNMFSFSGPSDLPQNFFASNQDLETFELTMRSLKRLPENFFINNGNLRKVNFDFSDITSLPADIFKPLINLITLDLSQNKLKTLNPEWFATLGKLEELSLHNNEIIDIPEGTFKKLTQLKTLFMQSNKLKTIHFDSFGVHPHLENVDFKQNQIAAIDERFIYNTEIQNLMLEGNLCYSNNILDLKTSKESFRGELKKCFENYHPGHDQSLVTRGE